MKWLFMFLLMIPVSTGLILNERASVEFYSGSAILNAYSIDHYYHNDTWKTINNDIKAYPGDGHEYKYYNSDRGYTIKIKDNIADEIVRFEYGDYHLTYTPFAIGYTNGEQEVKKNLTGVGLPDIDGTTATWQGLLNGSVDVMFKVENVQLRKELKIHDKDLLPKPPSWMFKGDCDQWCDDCKVETFIEYRVRIHDDLRVYVDGQAWHEDYDISSSEGFVVKDPDGDTLFTMPTSFLIGNYTGDLQTHHYFRTDLKKVDDFIRVRHSIPYYDFMGNRSFPMLIDPNVMIGETNWFGSAEYNNRTCTAQGNCCNPFPGGSCQDVSEPDFTCINAIAGGYLSMQKQTLYCDVCQPLVFDCCRLLGLRKLMMLVEFNWSSTIDIDYNQVKVNNATVELQVNQPFTNITVRHQDTEEGDTNRPYCRNARRIVHTDCPYTQPGSQASQGNMSFNFTDHVQEEFWDGHDKFFVFLDGDSTSASKNIPIEINLSINYTFDPCRPPFTGVWTTDCNCTFNDDLDVYQNWTINATGGQTDIYSTLTWNDPERYIIIDDSFGSTCNLTIHSGGGIN